MPGLIIWKNQQVDRLRKDMDRMFDRLWGEFGLSTFPIAFRDFPGFDLSETDDSMIVTAEVPGMNPDHIHIDISEISLSIKGEIRQNSVHDKIGNVRSEMRYGTFSKQIHLPCRIAVEKVNATYKDGILSIKMPKLREAKTREVKIER